MADISASVNERELMIMHKDFEEHVAKQISKESNDDADFFDDTPGSVGKSQSMEVEQSATNKRRLESEEEKAEPKNKIRCQGSSITSIDEVASGELAVPSQISEVISAQNRIDSQRTATDTQSGIACRETIILIKPEADKVNELMNDPIEIVTAIENSKFGKLNVKDIKTNKRKGLIVACVKEQSPAIIQELVNVKRIGKWKVDCYIPRKDRFKVGVISPISTGANVDKIKDILLEGYKIYEVERMNKKVNNEWVPSNSLKITFEERELPNEVVIGHSLYKVRQYINQPLQCYRCQRLGHTAEGCNSKIRCMVCGGEHVKEVCRAGKEQCANCKGNHKANSKYCELIKRAYAQEEKKRYGTGEGHIEMTDRRNWSQEQNGLVTSVTQAEVHHEMEATGMSSIKPLSYSERVKLNLHGDRFNRGSNGGGSGFIEKQEASTQTENEHRVDNGFNMASADFLSKLKEMLIEILGGIMAQNGTALEKVIDINKNNKSVSGNATSNDSNEQNVPCYKKYNTRQTYRDEGQKSTGEAVGGNMEVDSLDDGVLSSQDESDSASLYETVEKRQVRVNPSKLLTVEDFRKVRENKKSGKEGKKRGKIKRKL